MLLPSGTGLADAIVFAVLLVFCRYLFSMAFQLSRSMLSELIYIPPPFPIGGIKQYEFQHHRFKFMTENELLFLG